jgi:hypothetical protein
MKMGACILPEGHPHGFSDWRADGIKGFFAFSAAAFPMTLRSHAAALQLMRLVGGTSSLDPKAEWFIAEGASESD